MPFLYKRARVQNTASKNEKNWVVGKSDNPRVAKGLSDKPPQAPILPQAPLHLRGERTRPFAQGDGRATALLLRAEAQPLGELQRREVGPHGRELRPRSPEEIPLALQLERREVGASLGAMLLHAEALHATIVETGQVVAHLAAQDQFIALHAGYQTVILQLVFHNTPKFRSETMTGAAEDVKERIGAYDPPKGLRQPAGMRCVTNVFRKKCDTRVA